MADIPSQVNSIDPSQGLFTPTPITTPTPNSNIDTTSTDPTSVAPEAQVNEYGLKPESVRKIQDVLKSKPTFVGDGGTVYEFPNDKNTIIKVLQSGFKVESPVQRIVREVKEKNSGIGELMSQAGQSFVNQLLMGVPEIVQEHNLDPLEKTTREQLQAQNKLARIFGGVAGFGTNLVGTGSLGILGKVGEAGNIVGNMGVRALPDVVVNSFAGKVAKEIVSRGLRGATEGAAFVAPQVMTEAALGDPKAAAETLVSGVGLGAGFQELGGLGAAVLGVGGKVSKKILGGTFEDIANGLQLKASGFQKAQINKLTKQYGVTGLPERKGKIAKLLRENELNKINLTPEEVMTELESLRTTNGQAIEDVTSNISEAGLKPIDGHGVLSEWEKTFGPEYIGSQMRSSSASDYNTVRQDIADSVAKAGDGTQLGFDDLERMRADARNLGYKGGKPVEGGEVYRDAYKFFGDKIDEGLNKFEGSPLFPEGSLAKYKQAKSDYGLIMNAMDGVGNKLRSEGGNASFGITDFISGGAGAHEGGVMGGILGVALNKVRKIYGDQFAATSAYKLSKLVGKFGAAKDEAVNALVDTPLGKVSPRLATTSALDTLTQGSEATDNAAKLEAFVSHLSELKANPAYLANHISSHIGEMANVLPNVSMAATTQLNNMVDYLHNAAPKSMTPGNIFTKKPVKPTDAELSSFDRKLQAAINPIAILRHANSTPITAEHLDALNTLYPSLMQSYKDAVLAKISSMKTPLAYKTRLKLSTIFGADIDGSLKPANVMNLQNNFALTKKQQEAPSRANFSLAHSYSTELDRRANR